MAIKFMCPAGLVLSIHQNADILCMILLYSCVSSTLLSWVNGSEPYLKANQMHPSQRISAAPRMKPGFKICFIIRLSCLDLCQIQELEHCVLQVRSNGIIMTTVAAYER